MPQCDSVEVSDYLQAKSKSMSNIARQNACERVESICSTNGIDGVICYRPHEVLACTGHDMHWGLSVALCMRKRRPVVFVPQLEPAETLEGEFEVRRYPWGVMGAEPWAALGNAVAEVVGGARFGVDHSYVQASLPGNFGEMPGWPPHIASVLPGVQVAGLFDPLLTIKTPLAIEKIRITQSILAHGVAAYSQQAIPGNTEAQLAADVEHAVMSVSGEYGCKRARAWAHVQAGANSATAGTYSRSSGRLIGDGDLCLLEVGACVDGYWADLTRTVVATPNGGTLDHELIELVTRAGREAISLIKPGVRACDVDAVARSVIQNAGYDDLFKHPTGHPVGYRYHDSGPVLMPGFEAELEAGMVLTVEPGVYGERIGGGVRVEENVLVTESGYEVLSDVNLG